MCVNFWHVKIYFDQKYMDFILSGEEGGDVVQKAATNDQSEGRRFSRGTKRVQRAQILVFL